MARRRAVRRSRHVFIRFHPMRRIHVFKGKVRATSDISRQGGLGVLRDPIAALCLIFHSKLDMFSSVLDEANVS